MLQEITTSVVIQVIVVQMPTHNYFLWAFFEGRVCAKG